ncbi:MAG TPA: hypothetical protein VIL74_00150 [Pyrinomonadaceae bacterium]
MKKRNLPKKNAKEKIRRDKDPIPWRYCLLTLVCGTFLVGGFFVAARSHFASIDFGIKNSNLKKQLEDLEAEKRRLMWLKEKALSPAEIKRAAKKLGLTETNAANFQAFGARVTEKNEKTTAAAAAKKNSDAPKPLVEKTVDAKPVEKNGKDGAVKASAANAKSKEKNAAAAVAKK